MQDKVKSIFIDELIWLQFCWWRTRPTLKTFANSNDMSSLLRGVLFGMLRYFIQLRNTNLKPVPEHAHGLDKIKFPIYQKRTKQWQLLLQSVLRRFFFCISASYFSSSDQEGGKKRSFLTCPPHPPLRFGSFISIVVNILLAIPRQTEDKRASLDRL